MATQFIKYQHVERLGNLPTEGIMNGKIYVFPKLDGSNGSVGVDTDGKLWCASRNRRIGPDGHGIAGFYEYAHAHVGIAAYLKKYPTRILYGEWLIPHKVKYVESAYKHFWVFDIYDTAISAYIPYPQYVEELITLGVSYIPVIAESTCDALPNVTGLSEAVVRRVSLLEELMFFAEHNNFLLAEGAHAEGVVIKNYKWMNENKGFPRAWAKIISDKYADTVAIKTHVPKIVDSRVEEVGNIACTPDLIEKEFQKIRVKYNGWESKYIPELMTNVFEAVKTEELEEAKRKVGIEGEVNERDLRRICGNLIKQYKAELFR